MIHFLEERDEASKKENLALEELMKELQETHKQKVKSQADLLASIDRMTKQGVGFDGIQQETTAAN